jgi:hypothetical protein
LSGFQALSDEDNQKAVLWPLLYTWERSLHTIKKGVLVDQHLDAWQRALVLTGLDNAHRATRESALLEYIQLIELELQQWAEAHGA